MNRLMGKTLKRAAASYLSPRHTRGQTLLICAFLVAVGLVPRAGYAYLHRHDRLDGDEVEYDTLARGLAATGDYNSQPGFNLLYYAPWNEPTAFRPPGFPAVLAALYAAAGRDHFAARLLLAFVGALGAALVFLTAAEVYGDGRVGIAAGLAWALWPASISYLGTASYRLLSEGPAVLLLLAALWLLVRSGRRASLLQLAAAGVVLGLGVLTRGTLQVVVGFAVLWVLWAWWREGARRAAVAGVVLAASFLLAVGPWMARNYAKLGVLSVATQSDVFFFGNNAWARGSFDAEGGKIWDPNFVNPPSQQYGYIVRRHPEILSMTEREKSAVYKQEALDYALANKGRMVWLLSRKALLFWLPLHDVPGGFGYSFAYVFTLPFFLVGLAVALRRRDQAALLQVVPLVALFIGTLLTYAYPRYRFLAEPGMVIMAAGGAGYLVSRFSPKPVLIAASLWMAINLGLASFIRSGA